METAIVAVICLIVGLGLGWIHAGKKTESGAGDRGTADEECRIAGTTG